MSKAIHLDHAAAELATGHVVALVSAMMGNTERLRGVQKGLEAVLQGAMGDAYTTTMTSFNTDLSLYDAQVQKLNKAVQAAALQIQDTDILAGKSFLAGRS